MAAGTLKDFLIKLGFSVDPSSERKFDKSTKAATAQAVALGEAVYDAAKAVALSVPRMVENLEALYFSAQRIHASASNVQAFGFAVGQMGGTAEEAIGSLEALASKMRHSPGFEGLIKNQGVQTRVNGELRDTVDIMGDLAARFKAMPVYRGLAVSQAMGIDEKTFLAMRNGMGQFGAEYKAMLARAGVDSDKAAKGSHELMNEVRLLGASFSMLGMKITESLSGKVAEGLARLRKRFTEGFGGVTDVMAKVLGFLARLAEAIMILAERGAGAISRLVGWFEGLSEGSQNIIKYAGLMLLAWKALSSGFAATPLGRLVLLATAIASLWDDYQVWKEGGKSLIDWSKWSPGIEAALRGIEAIGEGLHKFLAFTGDWRALLEVFLAYLAGTWVLGVLGAVNVAATGIAARMAAALGGLATSGALLAAAGGLGYALGTAIYDKMLAGSKFADAIGRGIAKIMALFGNDEAKAALKNERGAAKGALPSAVAGKQIPSSLPPSGPAKKADGAGYADSNAAAQQAAVGALTKMGWTAAQAAGIVANFVRESSLNPRAVGDNGKAVGIGQWHPDRQAAFKEKFGKDIRDSTLEEQLQFAHHELTAGSEQAAGRLLRAARNAREAGMVVSEKYERPADAQGEAAKRGALAEQLARTGREMAPTASKAGRPVEISQTTSITVHSSDPAKAGREVALSQNGVNEQLVRNTAGAVLQ